MVEKNLKCGSCGDDTDDAVVYDNIPYCLKCFNVLEQCMGCGKFEVRSDLHKTDGGFYICNDCMNK